MLPFDIPRIILALPLAALSVGSGIGDRMPNLEQQLGELTGQLKALVPALENLEERQREIEERVTKSEKEIEHLRREFDEHKKKSSDNFNDLFNRGRDLEKSDGKLADRIKPLEDATTAVKNKTESLGKKIWDIVKILLAAVIGAGLTKLFGG